MNEQDHRSVSLIKKQDAHAQISDETGTAWFVYHLTRRIAEPASAYAMILDQDEGRVTIDAPTRGLVRKLRAAKAANSDADRLDVSVTWLDRKTGNVFPIGSFRALVDLITTVGASARAAA